MSHLAPEAPSTDRPAGADRSAEDSSGPRDWLSGSRWTRGDILIATLVGLAVVVVAYVFRSIIVPTDPWHYVRSARLFPVHDWVALGYTRYGIILASIPPVKILGNAQVAYYFWPILSAGVLAATTYLMAKRWWGWIAGAVAVILLFTNTVVFYNLSRGYPDIMSMAIFGLAIVAALKARDAMLEKRLPGWWLLAVGFLLGWGFEVRETSMLMWPLIAVILWRRDYLLRAILLVTLPVLGWAALDVGISWWAYGDPLLKLHTLTGLDISARRTDTGEIANAALVGKSRWFYVTYIPDRALGMVGGFWMVAAGAVALLGLAFRNGAVRLMSGWFVLVYGLTVLAGGALDPAHPRGKLDIARYWIPFVPATSLVVAGVVAVVGGWVARRLLRSGSRPLLTALPAAVLAVLVCVGPVATGVSYATTNQAFAPNGGAALEELRDHLRGKDLGSSVLWTDWETRRIIPPYQRDLFGGKRVWKSTTKSLTGAGEPTTGDYVLIFTKGSNTCPFCTTALAPWRAKHSGPVPATWTTDFVSDEGNLTLYRVR
jgi:hypothetical protein